MDLKKCYTAFKKCNEIGKKMTPSSKYVLINGMIIGFQNEFDKDDKSEYSACAVSVSFIDDKLCNDLDALAYIPLLINGTEVYRMAKEYEFNRFEVSDKSVDLIFRGLYTSEETFDEYFIDEAIKDGYDKEHIMTQISNGFLNDIDLYEKYLSMKKKYKPKEYYQEFKLQLKILYDENKILKKSNKVINDLLNCKKVSERDLDDEIYKRIMESGRPIMMKFKDENNNDVFRIRLMKSLFKTAVSSSKINMKVLEEGDNIYYFLLSVINKGFYTVNIYKTINF